MNNKNILRTAIPFIVIFFVSLIIAIYTYVQQNLSGVKAGDEALKVTLVNILTPLSTNETWQWKLIAQTDRTPSTPIELTYTANWCLKEDVDEPCVQGVSEDFFYQVGTGAVTVKARDTIAKITHQSVNCGRLELEAKRDGQIVGRAVYSTKTKCTTELSSSVGTYADSSTDVVDMINRLLNILLSFFGDEENPGTDNPGAGNPGGSPGGGGGGTAPNDQLCKDRDQACQEVYRAPCGTAGTKVCYKYGTCAGAGTGVQCSWGAGSYCEATCEEGTTINDPVPPIKPPVAQPPTNPGQPNPPAHEPLPLPDNADAQQATKFADKLIDRCVFAINGSKIQGDVTQYNVDSCTSAALETKNDQQARSEVVSSAHSYGSTQTRNGKKVGYNHLQCVGFVEGAVAAVFGQSYNGPGGNALSRCTTSGNYTCMRIGKNFQRVSQSAPQPNDIAVWEGSRTGPFGHVAYVVSGNESVFTVVEANQACAGCVRRNTYVVSDEIAQRNFAGFLRRR